MPSTVASKWIKELSELSNERLREQEEQAKSVAENASLREVIAILEQKSRMFAKQCKTIKAVGDHIQEESRIEMVKILKELKAAKELLDTIIEIIDENEEKDDPDVIILGIRNKMIATLHELEITNSEGVGCLNLGSLSKVISQGKQEPE